MNNCITCSNYNNNYKYIAWALAFYILNNIIFGIGYNNSCESIKIPPGGSFQNNHLIHQIFCYLGTCIFAYFFINYEKRQLKGQVIEPLQKQNNEKSSLQIQLIYDDQESLNKINKSFCSLFFFIIIIFLWIIVEQLLIFYIYLFNHLDFWMLELLIISYLNSKFSKIPMFKHQKFAIWLNIFTIIFKIFTIIDSFLDKYNKIGADEDVDLRYNNTNNNTNENNTKLKILYVNYIWLIPIGLAIYLILISLRSYININIKGYMDLKYISPNKLLIFYGFIGTIISFIICIVATFVECKENTNKKDVYDYVCKVKDDNNTYLENFNIYFNIYFSTYKNVGIWGILSEIATIILGVITFFFYKYYSMMIIKFLTPVYLIFSFPMYYFCEKLLLVINTLIFKKEIFYEPINFIEHIFFCDIAGDIFSFFGFLIYLEIIELKCCGLNKNLRQKIIDRGYNESHGNLDIDLNSSFNTESDEDGNISKKSSTNELQNLNLN